jgi:hypothetical protein
MRFGQARHEIDRLHQHLINRINHFKDNLDPMISVDEFKEILNRIRAIADRSFQDVVCNLDHLENSVVESIVEHVSKAYVEGKYGQSNSQIAS